MARTKKKNEIKLEQNELAELEAVKVTYDNILKEFGAIEIKRHETIKLLDSLEKRQEAATKALDDLKEYEMNVLSNLENKYGQGSLDIKSGIFTPAS